MLIDWMTLRFPLTQELGQNVLSRVMDCLGIIVSVDSEGKEKWRKHSLDIDKLRSDSEGLFWTITADGDSQRYLSIGGSPASVEHDGINVFGSMDIEHCAQVMVRFASVALGSVLPHWSKWQCRRMDITANYDMGSSAQVKQALRLLLATDAPRRRTNSDKRGGDSVYWNPSSDLQAGKAYHKGAHLRMMLSKGRIMLTESTLQLSDNLLRLELKLGSRWFRRLKTEWQKLTPDELCREHQTFFSKLIGAADVEVSDMGKLLVELEKVAPTKGRALAAHRTFALIKTVGYTQTKESMRPSTFYLHLEYLRAVGLSSADLCAGKVLELRKRSLVLEQPVLSWDEIKRAA